MPELCPRCEAALPTIDGNAAAFCAACGLPQLRVPADALEPQPSSDTGAAGAGTPRTQAGGVEWSLAFRILVAAAFLGLVPCALLPGVVVSGGAGFIALLLLPLLTLGSGAAYLRRRPFPAFTPAIGARLGIVLALLLAGVLTVSSGIAGFVLRYGLHSHSVQQNLDVAFKQVQVQMNASSTPLPASWMAAMQWPEMRAGAFLLSQVFTSMLLLLTGLIAGAISGALLGAQQRRSRQ